MLNLIYSVPNVCVKKETACSLSEISWSMDSFVISVIWTTVQRRSKDDDKFFLNLRSHLVNFFLAVWEKVIGMELEQIF